MGQNGSRSSNQQSTNKCYQPRYNGSQEWPRWATGLTQGLPQDGDRGLFRGEFILVQATQPVRSNIEPHPRCMQLYRQHIRHPGVSGQVGESSLHLSQSGQMTLSKRNFHSLRLPSDTNDWINSQVRLFPQLVKTQLGHIPEEEDEDVDNNSTDMCTNRSQINNSELKDNQKTGSNENLKGSVVYDDKPGIVNDDTDAYHYFANNLIKPVFVTSQRYGAFQTMTSRYESKQSRDDINKIQSLPRYKNLKNDSDNAKYLTVNNSQYMKADDVSHNHMCIRKCPSSRRKDFVFSNVYDATEATRPRKDGVNRPCSPIKDYSSSDTGISDSDDMTCQLISRPCTVHGRRKHKSIINPDVMVSRRRNSSSADSAFKEFDNCSSYSSDKNENDSPSRSNLRYKNRTNWNTLNERKLYKQKGRRTKYNKRQNNNVHQHKSEKLASEYDSKENSEDEDIINVQTAKSFTGKENAVGTSVHGSSVQEIPFLKNVITESFGLIENVKSTKNNVVISQCNKNDFKIQSSKIDLENKKYIASEDSGNVDQLHDHKNMSSCGNFTLKSSCDNVKSIGISSSPEPMIETEEARNQTNDLTLNKPKLVKSSEMGSINQNCKTKIKELQKILMRQSLPLTTPEVLSSNQSISPRLVRSRVIQMEIGKEGKSSITVNRPKSPILLQYGSHTDNTLNTNNKSFQQYKVNISNVKNNTDLSPNIIHKSNTGEIKLKHVIDRDKEETKLEPVFLENYPSPGLNSDFNDVTNVMVPPPPPPPPPAPPLPDSLKSPSI